MFRTELKNHNTTNMTQDTSINIVNIDTYLYAGKI